jgi:hypothetical protein
VDGAFQTLLSTTAERKILVTPHGTLDG